MEIQFERCKLMADQRLKNYILDKSEPIFYSSGGGWNGGSEDPRITKIEGVLYMTYTAFDGWGSVRIALTSISLEDFLNKYPQSPHLSAAKLLLGQCDFLRGQYDKALSLFEELSGQADNRDQILFWRAETYLKENRLLEAQRDYQSVVKK